MAHIIKQYFKWICVDNTDYIALDDLVNLLKTHKSDNDKRTVKYFNVERAIKTSLGGFKFIDGVDSPHISIMSAARYIFLHCENYAICRKIAHEIMGLDVFGIVQGTSVGTESSSSNKSNTSLNILHGRDHLHQSQTTEFSNSTSQLSSLEQHDDLHAINITTTQPISVDGNQKQTSSVCQTVTTSQPVSARMKQFHTATNETYTNAQNTAPVRSVSAVTSAPENKGSIYNLYQRVAKRELELETHVLAANICIPDNIPKLFQNFKCYFSNTEWCTIKLFEIHFQNHRKPKDTFDIDTEVAERVKYFQFCFNLKQFRSEWKFLVQNTITDRTKRKKAAEVEEDVALKCRLKHRPACIDASITSKLDTDLKDIVDAVVTLGCPSGENSVDVVVELQQQSMTTVTKITDHIVSILAQKHQLHCKNLMFVNIGDLQPFKRDFNIIARFTLQDQIASGSFSNKIWQTIQPPCHMSSFEETDLEYSKCLTCYDPLMPTPLAQSSFSITREWLLHTPLPIQIFLENFINHRYLQMISQNPSHLNQYLEKQLERLYMLFDALLNTHNKNHIGVIQLAFTDELLVHFKSIGSVFSVTNKAGITSSFVTAEESLKKRAIDDIRYYETYHKSYEMKYIDQSHFFVCKLICLRDCHNIFMLDNLMRLKMKDDPDPGESRSKQICTLPITLQGLPKDSLIAAQWHHPELCNGTERCACKKEIILLKEDIEDTLFNLTEEQQTVLLKYNQLQLWGSGPLWKDITNSKDYNTMVENVSKNETHEIQESKQETTPTTPVDRAQNDAKVVYNAQNRSVFGDVDKMVVAGDVISGGLLNSILLEEVNSQDMEELEQSFDYLQIHQRPSLFELDNIPPISNYESDTESSVERNEDSDDLESCTSSNTDEDCSEFFQSFMSQEDLELGPALEDTNDTVIFNTNPGSFNLKKFSCGPLLCRHPVAACGKDDDIFKLKEILDDQIMKLGVGESLDRILCGPDNKICANLIKLRQWDDKYKTFLPEFPVLHLRKSKITSLISAYKDTGLLHLLRYIRDDSTSEWTKLISLSHIDMATKHVKRLAHVLRISFILKFITTLPQEESEGLLLCLEGKNQHTCQQWNERFTTFMKDGCSKSATFALHSDWMTHCDEIGALHMAERMGGRDGYQLLLAVTKESLPFQFVNGAHQYAPLCTHLIYEYHRCGFFHQGMKHHLFSTPIGNSSVNFATDSKREMEHLIAVKMLRSGSTESSVIRRLAVLDTIAHTEGKHGGKDHTATEETLEWKFTAKDCKNILRGIEVVCRRGGLSLNSCSTPYNVYSKKKMELNEDILDDKSKGVGKFLVRRFIASNGLFSCTKADMPETDTIIAGKEFLAKAKRNKSVTIKRAAKKSAVTLKSDREKQEEKRQKQLKKIMKENDCLSSEMSNCQAVVKPDCSKPKVNKNQGVLKALNDALQQAGPSPILTNIDRFPNNTIDAQLNEVAVVTIDFAGVKFGSGMQSGGHYISYVKDKILKPVLCNLPSVQHVIICEEKYSFTPDDFKAATRHQRQKETSSIAHLKIGEDIISGGNFDREAVTTTYEGKTLIGTYLATHVQDLKLQQNLHLTIDSEKEMSKCSCTDSSKCTCYKFTTPTRTQFTTEGFLHTELLSEIKQRKGEAELSQVDWLLGCCKDVPPGKGFVSLVTSGDIDAVSIHLFALSLYWPRNENNSFNNPVYVILQKHSGTTKKYDLYPVTKIIEQLEKQYNETYVAVKVALGICMGGNDFLPKFYGYSHTKVLQLLLNTHEFHNDLITIDHPSVNFHEDVFVKLVQTLFCPQAMRNKGLSFEEVRNITMKGRGGHKKTPQKWLPPKSAVENIAKLVELQLQYFKTVGNPEAELPKFLQSGCLKKGKNGEVEYDFGPDAKYNPTDDTSKKTPKKNMKRPKTDSPLKGKLKKKLFQQRTSTPRK